MKTGQNSSNFRFIFIIGTVYLILACAVMIYLVVDAGLFEKERKELSSKLMKLNNSLSLLQLLIEKGETEGYAPLGSNGIVPESFLPSFVSNVQFNLGCWDAQFNFPQIN